MDSPPLDGAAVLQLNGAGGMSQTRGDIVTIFGSSSPPPVSDAYQLAFELGKQIAACGWCVCNGGYGGTMEAAAKGADSVGGHTIGVTLSSLRRGAVNPYIKQEVPTFDLLSRLNTLLRLGKAYVVLPGGTGTLLELSAAWELTNKSLLRRRKIITLGEFWEPLFECIRREQPDADPVSVAADPSEVCELLRGHFETS